MASGMKWMLMGYTGYAKVDGHNTLMTSFSLTMNENVIQSAGVGRILHDDLFDRFKMDAVRDYPGYDISITCDANFEIMDYFFSRVVTGFHSFIDVVFFDDASGIEYHFDKCCLTNLQLGVDVNAAASITVGFVTFKDDIEVDFADYDYQRIRYAPKELVGDVLLPYWGWGVEYPDFTDEDLYNFSISYTQQVTAKFGCYGEESDNALAPKKIVFGVPELKYEMTYIVADETHTHDYDIHSNMVSLSRKTLVVKYKQDFMDAGRKSIRFKFTMNDCYPDTYSPLYANSGDVNKMTVSGTVYGGVKYEKK